MNAPIPSPENMPSPENIARLPYRRGVGIMMLNRRSQVFVARRIDTSTEAWQMPQGGIDGDETPELAALRELLEETGTDRVELLGESRGWLRYDLPMELVPRVWGGCFRGQEQKWFLFRFTGEDSDIDIDTAQPEFAEWRWIEIEELPRLIVPFKQQLYLDLVDEFRYLVGQHRKET